MKYQNVLKSAPDRIEAYLEGADFYRGRGDAALMEESVEERIENQRFRSPPQLLPGCGTGAGK